jgi:hypothetical protein
MTTTDPADKSDYSEIVREIEAEVERLRALGWTQADFARALKGLLGMTVEQRRAPRKSIDGAKKGKTTP